MRTGVGVRRATYAYVIAPIQSKPDTTTNTDAASGSPGRVSTPLAFLNTLTAVAGKFHDAHGETSTDKKTVRDHKDQVHKKTDSSSPLADSSQLVAVEVTPVVPILIPAGGMTSSQDSTLTVPSTTDSTAAAAEISLMPSSPAATPPVAQIPLTNAPITVGDTTRTTPESSSKGTPLTDSVALSSTDAKTQTLSVETNHHEAALREAIAMAMQNAAPSTKDSPPSETTKDAAPYATPTPPPDLNATPLPTNAATEALAAAAPPTTTALNGMVLTKGIKGTQTVRRASPDGLAKATEAPGATATSGHHKTSAAEDASGTDASSTESDSDQSKGIYTSQPLEATSIQNSVAPHATTIDVSAITVPSPPHLSTNGATTQADPGAVVTPLPTHVAPPEVISTPMVHSARLIQSIQQTDMRVGINSAEFGAISIHTSTSQGLTSSEITLGHAELAKAINAHLSAMQDRPGPVQALSVRVETSSFTGGSSAGFSQGSQDQRQQRSEVSHPSNSRSTGSQPWMEQTPPAAARSQGALSDRLDIRV